MGFSSTFGRENQEKALDRDLNTQVFASVPRKKSPFQTRFL